MNRVVTLLLASTLLTACGNTLDRLKDVGKEPSMAKVDNPTARQDYQPVDWPLPQTQPVAKRGSNSLWQPGARSFFKDQRARAVGDILTVSVVIDDKAQLDNKTERTRDSNEDLAVPNVFGLEKRLFDVGPLNGDVNDLINVSGGQTTTGDGKIARKEKIETKVAALVTQVLPNGNLVISGRQQVRVNFEMREVAIEGVIRPEDIKSDNTIDLTQVAEARVSYGGRGTVSDLQQPRVGSQVLDILSPF